jgi:hypothetical protein
MLEDNIGRITNIRLKTRKLKAEAASLRQTLRAMEEDKMIDNVKKTLEFFKRIGSQGTNDYSFINSGAPVEEQKTEDPW